MTRSVVASSTSFSKSLASFVAAQALARAEAARACSTFVKRETELIVEKAQLKVEEVRMEAALTALRQEGEVAAAEAEAEILEAAAAEMDSKAGSLVIAGIPHESREKRKSDSVECHSGMRSSHQSLLHPEGNTAPAHLIHGAPSALPLQDSMHYPTHMAGNGQNVTPSSVKLHTSYSEVFSKKQPPVQRPIETQSRSLSSNTHKLAQDADATAICA